MNLENAAKNFFLQCIKDEEIINEIKKRLGNSSETSLVQEVNICNSQVEATSMQGRVNESDKAWTKRDLEIVENKITELIITQSKLEENINKIIINGNKTLLLNLIEKEEIRNNREIKNITEENEKLVELNKSLNQKLDKAITENNNIRQELKTIKNIYSPFDDIRDMWDKLERLDEETKNYIKQLCGNYNLNACISLGRDEGKIHQMWNYIREQAMKFNTEYKTLQILSDYFEFCLQVANSSKSEKEKYVIKVIEIGSEFDKEKCIRTSDSRQIGSVKQILSKCIQVENKVSFKAIVKVE